MIDDLVLWVRRLGGEWVFRRQIAWGPLTGARLQHETHQASGEGFAEMAVLWPGNGARPVVDQRVRLLPAGRAICLRGCAP